MAKILTTTTLLELYGEPGDVRNLVSMDLPFKMRIAWDKTKTISRFPIHKLAAPNFAAAYQDILCEYGEAEVKRLGIDLWGGCFNHRPKRGLEAKYAAAIAKKNYVLAASYLSSHSWAVAVDHWPEVNLLRETHKTARFARAEYKPMIAAFYRHGILGYGPEKDYDWMHWEKAA